MLPLCANLPAFLALSAIIGGTSALLLAMNLADAMAARPETSAQASGWNGAVQIGALAALGVALGSLVMPVSPAAPFVLSAVLAFGLALGPIARGRSVS